MIIHSTINIGPTSCLVYVEGIAPGMSEEVVQLFAQGAAAERNRGFRVESSALEWRGEDWMPLPEGSDTTDATCARVLCKVVEP